ncbi:MAG: efflux RND transporter periplasmic adaptor subunit [Methylomonas sp.]|nr:efflux RND transporter periplasmic adaptor subunit [Methylomonas sp.]
MRINRAPLFLPVLLILLSACEETNQEKTPTASANAPTVLVSHPQPHSFNTALQLTGTARPNQTVKLYAMTSGFLQTLHGDIGDFVQQGQTLAVLDNPELHSSKARLGAELQGKKSIYTRLNDIYQKTPQLTTITDVEKARAEYQSLKAQLDGVLSQIGFLTVKAPFAGVITRRYADRGALIQSGMSATDAQPLFELQDLRTIRVQVDVPETNVALIDKQSQADISFPELPEAHYAAAISRLAYGLNETTKTMKVEIDLPNPELKLRSGLYAKVEVQNSQRKTVLAVPNEAIGNIKGQAFIYVVNNGIVKKVAVTTGLRDEHATELLKPSLKATDTIIVKGKELVSDGASVQVEAL